MDDRETTQQHAMHDSTWKVHEWSSVEGVAAAAAALLLMLLLLLGCCYDEDDDDNEDHVPVQVF